MPVASSRIDLYLDNAERFVKSHGVIFVFIDRMGGLHWNHARLQSWQRRDCM